MECDVCVIGAGIAGLTTAYLLAKEGKRVIVLDAWGLSAGETGRTTAHLTAILDDPFFKIESLFGENCARLAARSHMCAINRIESIIKEEKIDCDFEHLDGYLVALDDDQQKDFDKEIEAVKRAGFADCELLKKIPIENIKINQAMRFPHQAAFHITKYMNGLATALRNLGGKIYLGRVVEVKSGEGAYAKIDKGLKVSAKNIVVATIVAPNFQT